MKKIISFFSVVVYIFLFTSCQKDITSKKEVSYYDGKHMNIQLLQNLYLNTDVQNYNSSNSLNVYNSHIFNLNEDNVLDILFNKNNVEYHEDKENPSYYESTNGSSLFIDDDKKFITYNTSFYNTINNCFESNECSYFYNLNNYSMDTDLFFMSKTDVISNVENIIYDLGWTNELIAKIYCCDFNTLKKEMEKTKEFVGDISPKGEVIQWKTDWSEEDDCYFIILKSAIDGIPITNQSHGSPDYSNYVSGSTIEACYSKNSLEYLNIYNLYDIELDSAENADIISVNQAINALKIKYKSIILTYPITVKLIELNYVPISSNKKQTEFNLVPAWCFYIDEQIKEDNNGDVDIYDNYSTIYFDAVTGKEIL